jgi:prolyl-tRNA synthetase
VIIPILSNASLKASVLEAALKLADSIKLAGGKSDLPYKLGVHVDLDDTKQPGWKFHEYELLGIPVRIELGPRDLEKGQVVVTRRDTGKKEFLPIASVPDHVTALLATIQKELLERARAFRDANTLRVENYSEFGKLLDETGGFFIAPWCQGKECEAKIKE